MSIPSGDFARSLQSLSKKALIDLLLTSSDQTKVQKALPAHLKAAKDLRDKKCMEVLNNLTSAEQIECMLHDRGAELQQMIRQDW